MNVTPPCDLLADDKFGSSWVTSAVYLSFFIGVPLNFLIIYRLYIPGAMKPYRYYLMTQGLVDTLLVTVRLLTVFQTSNCFPFLWIIPSHYFIITSTLLINIQLLQASLLMVYWKHAVRAETCLDRSLYTTITCSFLLITVFFTWDFSLTFERVSIIDAVYTFFYQHNLEINLILYAPVCIACFLTFISVLRLQRPQMSEVTSQGIRRVAKSLFMQAIVILTRGICGAAEGFAIMEIKTMKSIQGAVILLLVAPQMADQWPADQRDSLKWAYIIVYFMTIDAIFEVLIVPARALLMWWAI